MVLTIPIPPEAERTLRFRATAAGQDLQSYVANIIVQLASPPTPLEELSGPIHQNFVDSGLTDDQLGDLLEEAKRAMRAERRARQE